MMSLTKVQLLLLFGSGTCMLQPRGLIVPKQRVSVLQPTIDRVSLSTFALLFIHNTTSYCFNEVAIYTTLCIFFVQQTYDVRGINSESKMHTGTPLQLLIRFGMSFYCVLG